MEVLADGRYEVIRRLAVGGMGEVLLADHTREDDLSRGLVVIKRVLPASAGAPPDPALVRMFREEARLSMRLAHTNLVHTFRFDEGSRSSGPLLIIELLAGQPMSRVMDFVRSQESVIPLDVALRILRDSCCGLHFAHTLRSRDGRSLGLVHRDVSPTNIFVTYDGRVKVIDFGVAKATDTELRTATGQVKGKNSYMSPEQALGERRLTAATDVWALGVYFWESVLVRRLFRSRNPAETFRQITEQPITPLSALRPDVPPEVDAIVARMLARSQAERFSSCAEVVRAIDALPMAAEVHRADVGAYVASLFPEARDEAMGEAARAARPRNVAPLQDGLVDGPISDMDEAESQLATSSFGMKTASVPMAQFLSGDAPAFLDDSSSGDPEATEQLDPKVVAIARSGAAFAGSIPRPAALSGSSSGNKAKPPPRSVVGGSAAGAAALIGGLVLSAVGTAPAEPLAIAGFRDELGRVMLVADPAHLPPNAAQRFSVDLRAPVLPGTNGTPAAVDGAVLRQRLADSGVWRRASLPRDGARVLAVLPLLLVCSGLLTLAFLLPTLASGTVATAGRVLLVGAVCVATFLGLRLGVLGWPGTQAWRAAPLLHWNADGEPGTKTPSASPE